MSEENSWDLSLQIERLSLRLRGLRLGASSSFSFVSAPDSSRVHPAQVLELDLAAGPNPLSAASLLRSVLPPPVPIRLILFPQYTPCLSTPCLARSPPSPCARGRKLPCHFLLCRTTALVCADPCLRVRSLLRAERACLAGCWAKAVLDG